MALTTGTPLRSATLAAKAPIPCLLPIEGAPSAQVAQAALSAAHQTSSQLPSNPSRLQRLVAKVIYYHEQSCLLKPLIRLVIAVATTFWKHFREEYAKQTNDLAQEKNDHQPLRQRRASQLLSPQELEQLADTPSQNSIEPFLQPQELKPQQAEDAAPSAQLPVEEQGPSTALHLPPLQEFEQLADTTSQNSLELLLQPQELDPQQAEGTAPAAQLPVEEQNPFHTPSLPSLQELSSRGESDPAAPSSSASHPASKLSLLESQASDIQNEFLKFLSLPDQSSLIQSSKALSSLSFIADELTITEEGLLTPHFEKRLDKKIDRLRLLAVRNPDASLEKLGRYFKQLKWLDLQDQPITDQSLQLLAQGLPQLTHINLDRTAVTDLGVIALARECKQLTGISLESTQVTGQALQELGAHSKELLAINLRGAKKISDPGLIALAQGCRKLTHINLNGTAVTDSSIQTTASLCPNLDHIDLRVNELTDAALQTLAEHCPHVSYIDLSPWSLSSFETHGERITDLGIQAIAQHWKKLTQINLSYSSITDLTLQALAKECPGLIEINLEGTKVTDAGVEALAKGCRHLRFVILDHTPVTDKGVQAMARFCQELCRISAIHVNNTTCDTLCLLYQSPHLTHVRVYANDRTEREAKKILGDRSKSLAWWADSSSWPQSLPSDDPATSFVGR